MVMKSYCDVCRGDKNHVVLHSEKRGDNTEDMFWSAEYMLLQCQGCDHVSFRMESSSSEDWPGDGPNVEIFPRTKVTRQRPVWFEDFLGFDSALPVPLNKMLRQVYEAFDEKLFWLVIMGTRAVIEAVMISKVGDQKSFAENLSQFSKQGYITDSHRQALNAAIDEGSAAIHKAKITNSATALAAIQVMENVLEAIYVLPEHEKQLKGK
jgi:Domain of unknown function (DUF4145)